MTALYESRDLAASASEKLKVYAQPQRLMILSCLLRSERNVAEIGEATGIGQPALSQQLGELRRASLVGTRKKAKQVWYTLADESVWLCVQTMEMIFSGSGDLEVVRSNVTKLMGKVPVKPLSLGAASFAQIL